MKISLKNILVFKQSLSVYKLRIFQRNFAFFSGPIHLGTFPLGPVKQILVLFHSYWLETHFCMCLVRDNTFPVVDSLHQLSFVVLFLGKLLVYSPSIRLHSHYILVAIIFDKIVKIGDLCSCVHLEDVDIILS
jgi:hypothetical protein